MYVICAFIADIHRCIRRGDLIPRNENVSTVLGPGFRGIANNSQSGLLITLFEVLTKRTGVCDYIFSYHTFVSCSILFSMVYIEMNFFYLSSTVLGGTNCTSSRSNSVLIVRGKLPRKKTSL